MKLDSLVHLMTLIAIMVVFCQNYRSVDQKSINNSSILSFFVRVAKDSIWGLSIMMIIIRRSYARIID